MDLSCLDTVVGLTAQDYDCFVEPAAAATSLSGYHIDDIEDGIPLQFPDAARTSADDTLFDLMVRARAEAIKDFVTDLHANIMAHNKVRVPEIKGQVGEIQRNKNVPLGITMADYAGFLLKSCGIKGSKVTISRILIRLDANVTDDLVIYHSEDNFAAAIETIEFTAVADTLFAIVPPAPLELPLTNGYGHPITYAFVYDRNGAGPYNYRFDCSTCSNKRRPYYYRYAEPSGFTVADPTGIADLSMTSYVNRSYGLVLDARFTCQSVDWLCRPDPEDWVQIPFFRVAAKTLQLMIINKLIGAILSSPKISRFTMVKTEYLYGKRNHNRKMIAERMTWLATSIPEDAVDCYVCKAAREVIKAPILV